MNWSRKQYEEYLIRRGLKPDTSSVGPVLKYRNQKTMVDGFFFASTREAEIYRDLKSCRSAGVIRDLVLQPRFLLQEGFTDASGKKHRPVYYVADFSYVVVSDGHTVVVDVKSKVTEANALYRLKRKLFLFRYRDVVFHELF